MTGCCGRYPREVRAALLIGVFAMSACGGGPGPILTGLTTTTAPALATPEPTVRGTPAPAATPESESSDGALTTPEPTNETGPSLPSDPIALAAIAFVGNPPQDEIRSNLNTAFEIYRVEQTDENYSRAASALVALRQDAESAGRYDVTEMAILDAMIADGGLPGTTFSEAAGWMATSLRLE